jgi:hypothetical protein
MIIEVSDVAQLLLTLDRLRKTEHVIEVSRMTDSSADSHSGEETHDTH